MLVGTKAQLVKMAPVIKLMEQRKLPFKFVLTGQHTETLDDLIAAFGIRQPDDVLVDIGESDTRFKLFRWLVTASNAVGKRTYFREGAKAILVHGDTLSTLFGALVGKRYTIPVAHIEAGLRSYNYFHPFPEEIIRVLVSRLSSVHYSPGKWACNNLGGISGIIVDTQENTLLDSLRYAIENINLADGGADDYAVVSMHRHENLSNRSRLEFLLEEVVQMSEAINVKFILHPVTRTTLAKTGLISKLEGAKNVTLSERMNYLEFISLLSCARFLVTDGGSNQEEASYMQLPCLLLRKHTERQEGLNQKVVISEYSAEVIREFVSKNSNSDQTRKYSLPNVSPASIIVDHLFSGQT